MAVRLIGIPWKPTAALELRFEVYLDGGAIVLTSPGDAAWLTVGAANEVWQPIHLLTDALQQARQWIFNAIGGDPGVANTGAVTAIPLTGTLSLSETPGGSRFVWTLTGVNSTPATTLQKVRIINTNGAWTPLGIVEDGETVDFTASGGTVTITGQFQPRTIFTFPQFDSDSGDRLVRASLVTHPVRDGDVFSFESGGSYTLRNYKLIDLPVEWTGPSYPVGLFSDWGATRKIIELETTDLTVLSGDLADGVLYDLSNVAEDDYVTIEGTGWCSRVKTVDTTDKEIELWEPFPSSVTASAGAEVRVISEAEALEMEALRTGYFCLYGMNDEEGVPRYGQAPMYAIYNASGEKKQEDLRRSLNDPLYGWAYPLIRYSKPKLTLPG
jgi:hypothetical protein